MDFRRINKRIKWKQQKTHEEYKEYHRKHCKYCLNRHRCYEYLDIITRRVHR